MKRVKSLLISWEALLAILLLSSIVIGSVVSPYFLSGFNFNALTSNIMEIAIMALPMTLIIIAGEIDLSVASTLGLASVVLGLLWVSGLSLWLAIGAPRLVSLLVRSLTALLVTT